MPLAVLAGHGMTRYLPMAVGTPPGIAKVNNTLTYIEVKEKFILNEFVLNSY